MSFKWDCEEAKKDYEGYNKRMAQPMLENAFERAIKDGTCFILLNEYTTPVLRKFYGGFGIYSYKGRRFTIEYDRADPFIKLEE